MLLVLLDHLVGIGPEFLIWKGIILSFYYFNIYCYFICHSKLFLYIVFLIVSKNGLGDEMGLILEIRIATLIQVRYTDHNRFPQSRF